MKKLFFFCLMLTALAVKAQDDAFNPYFLFEEGASFYLLADQVNARKAPDLKSAVISKLPIASKIKIIEFSETVSEINTVRAPWYKVSFSDKGKNVEAFIWGGFISLRSENAVNANGVIFLHGISKIEEVKKDGYTDYKVTMQARAAKGNKEIAKIDFQSFGSMPTSRELIVSGPRGVEGLENILDFSYSDNYCGGAFGNQIYFWDGKKFIFVKNLQSGVDAPCFSFETFIYPEDEGGKKDLILLKFEAGCELEEEESEVSKKMTEYSWSNNKLTQLKEYDIK
jgi:hypothetical protein